MTNAIHGIANGMGEVAIEEQEFKNAVGSHIGCINLAIRLKRRAAAQQSHLLEILVASMLAFRRTGQPRLVHLKQRGNRVRALQVAAKTDKLPTLTMNHRD